MQFVSDEAKVAWQKTVDAHRGEPYGAAIMAYVQRWAEMMECELAGVDAEHIGQWIENNARNLSYRADTEGITGFMYGCAVLILAKGWVHGEHLRRWHNVDIQLNGEGDKANETGGVLNPALFQIGSGKTPTLMKIGSGKTR